MGRFPSTHTTNQHLSILVPQSGIEPTSPAYKTGPHPLKVSGAYVVPSTRIELVITAYQATVIPFNYKGILLVCVVGFEPTTSHFQGESADLTALHTDDLAE